MTDDNQRKQNNQAGGINPVAAAVTGAVVGVGVAVAMQDEKNREKVKEVLINAKDQAIGYIEDVQQQAQAKNGEVEIKNSLNVKKK